MAAKVNPISDLREYRELRANSLGAAAGPATLGEVQGQEVVSAQLYAFAPKRIKKRRPVLMRNPLPLAPLLDRGLLNPNVVGHLGKGSPSFEEGVKRSHVTEYAPDELSGQVPPNIPVTRSRPLRTISPMGRGVTPVKFRSEMAKRLRAARIMARYETQKEAAAALGVGLDRYEKWENGRTPVPAQFISQVCELYGVDANYLFDVDRTAAGRRAG